MIGINFKLKLTLFTCIIAFMANSTGRLESTEQPRLAKYSKLTRYPKQVFWLAVNGANSIEFVEILKAAKSWEQATNGIISLPVYLGKSKISESTVSIQMIDDIPNDVNADTCADIDTATYRHIRVFRSRSKDYLSCFVAHEIGHVLRNSPTHDKTGLMSSYVESCDISPELAKQVMTLTNASL
jgi:hypothetical protein